MLKMKTSAGLLRPQVIGHIPVRTELKTQTNNLVLDQWPLNSMESTDWVHWINMHPIWSFECDFLWKC